MENLYSVRLCNEWEDESWFISEETAHAYAYKMYKEKGCKAFIFRHPVNDDGSVNSKGTNIDPKA